ncbi:TonB-dependent receptor [Sphingomonas yantingensis]|uniref:Iron complex outermembrane receptor protein n=1 Tax=Sphingomonas yantingensis TaxID=1241761 RepID=A0A7W9ANZ1_9SPHN|nr:TonB-dependent receptor [Sphingomonas yantingensis]MBB5697929.1 iron complex outermembrane receptor protein [Sphingomonas yantingensis]
MKHNGLMLLAGASLATLAMPAAAQEAQPGATADNPPEAAAQEAADAAQTGDIIVTATRRASRLQDVPLAVNAVSGEQLAESGFQSLTDIQYQIPGVQFGNSPNDAGFRLRGVGSAGGFSSSSEQNVGTVVDGVVIPFGNPVQSLGDLDRVEVLKGPQGTQFGKNASSGVVSITTAKPRLGTFGGTINAAYGELNDYNVGASVNVPLGKTAALSVYGFARGYDGFVENVKRGETWGGTNAYGGRAKLYWEPSDNFSAYLIGDWSRTKQKGPGQLWTFNRLPSNANPLNAARNGTVLALGIVPGFDNEQSAEDSEGYTDEKNFGGSLELNLKLGDYNLTSITAYRRLDYAFNTFAIDAYPLPIFVARGPGDDRDYWSQELRLTSPTGSMFEYVAGVYLSRQRSGIDGYNNSAQLRPALPFSAQPQLSITAGQTTTKTQSDSAAAFFDGAIKVSDEFRILLGGRYSYDWVDAESFSVVDPLFPPFVGPNGFTVPYTPRARSTGSTEKGDWSGRVGFEVKPAQDILFYGTVARGYLGPTVTFSGLTGSQVQVKPQTVVDITVGAKTQLFDRRLTFNANVFFDTYRDLQTSVFNGLEFLTENAGGFEAAGFEVEGTWRFNRNFSVNAGYTYSDTYFTDYVTACPDSTVAAGAAAVAAQCNAPGSTATTPLFQAKGLPLSGAPKHSVQAGANLDLPINDRLKLDASGTYYYRSEVTYDPGELYARQPGYDVVGLNIGIGAPDGSWRVGAFARNLFDTKFQSAVIVLPFTTPGGAVNWNTRDGRRTIGVQLSGRF